MGAAAGRGSPSDPPPSLRFALVATHDLKCSESGMELPAARNVEFRGQSRTSRPQSMVHLPHCSPPPPLIPRTFGSHIASLPQTAHPEPHLQSNRPALSPVSLAPRLTAAGARRGLINAPCVHRAIACVGPGAVPPEALAVLEHERGTDASRTGAGEWPSSWTGIAPADTARVITSLTHAPPPHPFPPCCAERRSPRLDVVKLENPTYPALTYCAHEHEN